MAAACDALQAQGKALLEQEHVAADQMVFALSADLRYVGQEYTLSIPFGRSSSVKNILAAFHGAHERRFGHAQPQNPVEFVNLRLAAIGRLERARQGFAFTPQTETPEIGEREVVFASQSLMAKVYSRALFTDQARYSGPAIIEEESATTFVPPGYDFGLDAWANILIQKEE